MRLSLNINSSSGKTVIFTFYPCLVFAYFYINSYSKQPGVAIMLQSCIQEVHRSNIGSVTVYFE
jgi:hypothetical protein